MIANPRTLAVRTLIPAVALLALLTTSGCKKKTSAPMPPPPPAATGPAPSAQLSANPTAINPGDQVVLTWRTTDATDVAIDQIGPVPSSGTRTVAPTESTNYHLTARGDGGSTDATVRVTVTASGAGSAAPSSGSDNTMDEATFHQNVQDIFYDYDSYEVTAESQAIIAKDASFLAAHPGLRLVIGGYTDERGSTEYNLALGENRANAAKVALTTAGVAPDRVRTVSYGKEKQFCSEHNETCWQQNRRAQFSIDR
ncbi:MAG TPA: OmpA family protein [Acidisarcina sp.]